MWSDLQENVDLVTFAEEILNEKLHFVCNVKHGKYMGQRKPVLWHILRSKISISNNQLIYN